MEEGAVVETYVGTIPNQNAGTKVHYFISAEAVSGKEGNRPMPAPQGSWSFRVTGPSTGLHEQANASSPWSAVYPNPGKAISCFELNLPAPTACLVELRNAMGQRIQTLHDGTLQGGTQRLFVDAATLANGPYLVVLTTETGHAWSHRWMVHH